MKQTLYTKFVIAYAVIAAISLAVITTLGSWLIEQRLLKYESSNLYRVANYIARTDATVYFNHASPIKSLDSTLSLTAKYTNSQIQVLNTQGKVLIDTSRDLDEIGETYIPNFNPTKFGSKYYAKSDFYGTFEEPMLNVLVPVTSGMTLHGYVTMHMKLTYIYEMRQNILGVVLIITGIVFALSLLILLLFTLIVYQPLAKITEGSQQFASGNLKYRIPLKSNDEMGYLAKSMNMMAREIDKGNEYQKTFISNISHDFRSPLTSIKGFTEAMVDGTIPLEMHEKYLNIISQESDRLVNLTQNVLKLSNMDPEQVTLSITEFDINQFIRDTAALFEGSCRKKRISFRLVLTGESLMVKADHDKIQQVLYNLLDNAIKFSDKNSEIKIETTEQFSKCYISVKDYGSGIKKEDLARIWNRFYKTDYSRGKDRTGSGLGLSIVKEIIRAHGQNISVSSTEGVGTEFVFTLPLVQ
ncbi:MAG: ATP-binding protein [Lachnospiraceae bacterium]|jgi:signal transduction histidine kinase